MSSHYPVPSPLLTLYNFDQLYITSGYKIKTVNLDFISVCKVFVMSSSIFIKVLIKPKFYLPFFLVVTKTLEFGLTEPLISTVVVVLF